MCKLKNLKKSRAFIFMAFLFAACMTASLTLMQFPVAAYAIDGDNDADADADADSDAAGSAAVSHDVMISTGSSEDQAPAAPVPTVEKKEAGSETDSKTQDGTGEKDSSEVPVKAAYAPTNEDYADVSPFTPDELWLMKQVKLLVDAYQVDVPDKKMKKSDLTYWAIRGMLSAYGDVYTRFLNPEEVAEEMEEQSGNFVGIGITIVNRDGDVVVVAPIDDSPAAKAGIRALDVITKVDGKDVEPNKLNATAKRLRGEEGTEVRVTISRAGENTPLEFTLVRAPIVNKSVSSRMLENDIGYIRVNRFIETTGDEFETALYGLVDSRMKGLIIDMRDNPGGLVNAAVSIADLFLEDGKIVTMRGRNSFSNEEYTAKPGVLADVPVVQLLNEGSASASEILAGCLRDRIGAVTVGMKSFGKGCAQTFFNLSDGSGVYVTNILYYLPDGESIHHKGIMPDITVVNLGARPDEIASLRAQGMNKEADEKEKRGDTQLKKAVETIQKLIDGTPREKLKDPKSTVVAKKG